MAGSNESLNKLDQEDSPSVRFFTPRKKSPLKNQIRQLQEVENTIQQEKQKKESLPNDDRLYETNPKGKEAPRPKPGPGVGQSPQKTPNKASNPQKDPKKGDGPQKDPKKPDDKRKLPDDRHLETHPKKKPKKSNKCSKFFNPFKRRKPVWEQSEGNIDDFSMAEESGQNSAKYPLILRILENKLFDVIFVLACLASVFLFTFSEGFLIKGKRIWGIIHFVNAVFTFGLLSTWIQILVRSKYAKTNQEYDKWDIIFAILTVFPADLILLAYFILNNKEPSDEDHILITSSRLNYIFRLRYVFKFFDKLENQLIISDFLMFIMRISLYTLLLLHIFACGWHRIACHSFSMKHFLMTPMEASIQVCENNSWVGLALNDKDSPLFKHEDMNVLAQHYFVTFYWAINTCFRLGYGDIHIYIGSNTEIVYTAVTQIVSWIFYLTIVCGTLTSLIIEGGTERENFNLRRFAIEHYINFRRVNRKIVHEIHSYYDYLWEKSKGIIELELIDLLPSTMKQEVFYEVNKFVLEQIPLFANLEESFLMRISIYMQHKFYLKGEILYKKNNVGDQMFYLIKGFLEVLDDDENVIAHIRSGSAIGEVFLMHRYLQMATVRCGSACDTMILTRDDLKKVFQLFPHHHESLQGRIDARFQQSALLLSLCDKQNEASKLFSKLKASAADQAEDFESLKEPEPLKSPSINDQEYDGLNLKPEAINKIRKLTAVKQINVAEKLRRQYLEEDPLVNIEQNVVKANSLAKDLGLPRAPLYVTAPPNIWISGTGSKNLIDSPQSAEGGMREKKTLKTKITSLLIIISKNKGPADDTRVFWWKLIILTCALAYLWFALFQFAYRTLDFTWNYCFHIPDLLFGIDFWIDMLQIVVTPQRTIESIRDILRYRVKTFKFYYRLYAFLPIEYILAPLLGIHSQGIPYFYLLKLNRAIELFMIGEMIQIIQDLPWVTMISLLMIKFSLLAIYLFHIFAVLYAFVLRDLMGSDKISHLPNGTSNNYEYPFYFSMQVATTTGYGDVPYRDDAEVVVLALATIAGTILLAYFGAKVSSVLANIVRKRVTFKQNYYAVQSFMKKRMFPKALLQSVSSYYLMQWKAHEGTIIPSEKLVIWDAPESLIEKISMAQAKSLIHRLPFAQHWLVQKDLSLALKQYYVPPGEQVLYPFDRRREFYIIVKGFCKVLEDNEVIGHLSEGSYFGLQGLIKGINKKYQIVTDTHCKFFCLTYEEFDEIAKKNPFLMSNYKILRGDEKTIKTLLEARDPGIIEPSSVKVEKISILSRTSSKDINLAHGKIRKRKKKRNFFLRWLLFRWAFLPTSFTLASWTMFRTFIALLSSLFAMCQCAFSFNPTFVLYVTFSLDIIAWLDLYVMLNVAYYGRRNQLIEDKKMTALHYFKTGFILDFLACFPIEWIAIYLISPKNITSFRNYDYKGRYYVISFLRLNRCLQAYKIFMLNILLERIIFKSLTFLTLIEVIPLMILFINTCSCFSVLLVCYPSLNAEPMRCSENAWLTHGTIYQDLKPEEISSNSFKMYLIGNYWITATALNVGFGDIDVLDAVNRHISKFIMILGVMITAYASSKLTACIGGEDSRRIEIRDRMIVMFNFLDQFHVSREIQARVKECYYNDWEKTKGISPSDLFVSLYPSLKSVVTNQLYEPNLRKSPLFKDLDEAGIRMLSFRLVEFFFPEGEYLIRNGDLNSDVLFISTGVGVAYDAKGEIMTYLGPGSLIGEMAALFGLPRLYSVVAGNDLEAFVFSKEDFLEFINLYPNLKRALEEACLKHYSDLQGTSYEAAGKILNVNLDEDRGVADEMSLKKHRRKLAGDAGKSRSKEEVISIVTNTEVAGIKLRSGETEGVVLDPLRIHKKERDEKSMGSGSAETSDDPNDKWWSFLVTFGKIPRDEMGIIHIIQDLNKCNIINFTIHPASPTCSNVSFFLLLTCLSCSFTAYVISFTSHEESMLIKVAQYILEIFFVVRIVGNFHLAYYDPETTILVTSVKKITLRYCRQIDGLVMDLLSTLPFYLFAELIPKTPDSRKYDLLRSNLRILQLLRVALFLRYLKDSDSDLRMKATRVKLFKITIILCFIFHFGACVWYLVSCYGTECTKGSWMHTIIEKMIEQKIITSKEEVTTGTRYSFSLYFVVAAITFTGFADITPRSQIEIMTATMMMLSTVFVIGFFVGDITQSLTSSLAAKIHYQHELKLIESHFVALGLGSQKLKEVKKYFRLLWLKSRGLPYHVVLSDLPFSLAADIAFEIYGPNLKNSQILAKLEDSILRQICVKVKHEIFQVGAHILRAGEVCDRMYLIRRGEIAIVDESQGINMCIEVLYENECFGEVKILLPREQYRFSYVTRLESEVGILMKSDLEQVLDYYPQLRTELENRANRIKDHILELEVEPDSPDERPKPDFYKN